MSRDCSFLLTSPIHLLAPEQQAEVQDLRSNSGSPGHLVHVERRAEDAQTAVFGAISTDNNLFIPNSPRSADSAVLRWLWPIASYSKVFINLAFIRIVTEPDQLPFTLPFTLTWDTEVNQIFETIRTSQETEAGTWPETVWPQSLPANPRLGELLLHVNGAVEMNRCILGPEGRCILTKEAFLRMVAPIAERKRGSAFNTPRWLEYTNANHIIAGILLERMFPEQFTTIMQELVFKPLGMKDTIMGRDLLPEEKTRLVSGYHVTSDRETRRAREPSYGDTVGKYVFASYSSISDLALFNRSIAAADQGHPVNFLSKQTTEELFAVKIGQGSGVSLFGDLFPLTSEIIVPRSLNDQLIPSNTPKGDKSCKLPDETAFMAYRMVGSIDGYSITTYYFAPAQSFVIVLGNSSGHFDVADYIAHSILQNTYPLEPKASLNALARSRSRSVEDKLRELEVQDNITLTEHDVTQIAGRYRHALFEQELKIESNGRIFIHGSSPTPSGPFKVIRLSSDQVRIVPGETPFGIERRTAWEKLDFTLGHTGTVQSALVDADGNRYERSRAGTT